MWANNSSTSSCKWTHSAQSFLRFNFWLIRYQSCYKLINANVIYWLCGGREAWHCVNEWRAHFARHNLHADCRFTEKRFHFLWWYTQLSLIGTKHFWIKGREMMIRSRTKGLKKTKSLCGWHSKRCLLWLLPVYRRTKAGISHQFRSCSSYLEYLCERNMKACLKLGLLLQ